MALRSLALAAALAAAAALPAAAHADSLVYIDSGGHVAIAGSDGSGAHAVTSDTGWLFPSESDSGTVAALAGSGAISVMDQYGNVANNVPTYASVSGGFDVTQFPRISPDGSKVAYNNLDPSREPTVYWSPTSATSLDTPNQTLGQEDTTAPSWIDSTHMFLTHFGETLTDTQDQIYTYTAGNPDNSENGWALDPYTPSAMNGDSWEATGFAAAVSRQLNAAAIAMDDNADYGGTTHNAAIDIFPIDNTGHLDTTNGCRYTLMSPNGSDDSTTANDSVTDSNEISPSFSPDGSKLAFATDSGVWVLSVPDDYTTCAPNPSLVIAGGTYPYWSPAGLQAPPPPRPPAGGGGGGSTGSGGSTPPQGTPAAPIGHLHAAFSFPHKLRARHKIKFSAGKSSEKGGKIVRYRWSFGDHTKTVSGRTVTHKFKRPGKYTITLTITDAGGHKAKVKHRVTVKR